MALLHALTIIAHDLRGPLANLSLLLELIETHARMQALDRMHRSTRRAHQLIDVLDATLQGFLSRVRETGDPLSFRPGLVDLGDIVHGVVRQNEPMALSRGITLDGRLAYPLVVEGDERLLIEAVDNLIGNALKHGPRDSTVTCSIDVRDRMAIIAITDAGQGLAADALERAFEPFAALSPRFKKRGSSWGLGLWIVRLIAERHGGRVEVRPTSGGGTTFELHLPLGLL